MATTRVIGPVEPHHGPGLRDRPWRVHEDPAGCWRRGTGFFAAGLASRQAAAATPAVRGGPGGAEAGR